MILECSQINWLAAYDRWWVFRSALVDVFIVMIDAFVVIIVASLPRRSYGCTSSFLIHTRYEYDLRARKQFTEVIVTEPSIVDVNYEMWSIQ